MCVEAIWRQQPYILKKWRNIINPYRSCDNPVLHICVKKKKKKNKVHTSFSQSKWLYTSCSDFSHLIWRWTVDSAWIAQCDHYTEIRSLLRSILRLIITRKSTTVFYYKCSNLLSIDFFLDFITPLHPLSINTRDVFLSISRLARGLTGTRILLNNNIFKI